LFAVRGDPERSWVALRRAGEESVAFRLTPGHEAAAAWPSATDEFNVFDVAHSSRGELRLEARQRKGEPERLRAFVADSVAFEFSPPARIVSAWFLVGRDFAGADGDEPAAIVATTFEGGSRRLLVLSPNGDLRREVELPERLTLWPELRSGPDGARLVYHDSATGRFESLVFDAAWLAH
jgi:hypothetical protein